MIRTYPRRARRRRHCDSCWCLIPAGVAYLEHVASPGHGDLGNTHWWRTHECAGCAVRPDGGVLASPLADDDHFS